MSEIERLREHLRLSALDYEECAAARDIAREEAGRLREQLDEWKDKAFDALALSKQANDNCESLSGQLDALATVAAQYLDTGRGDLDGRIAAARAALGVEGEQEKR